MTSLTGARAALLDAIPMIDDAARMAARGAGASTLAGVTQDLTRIAGAADHAASVVRATSAPLESGPDAVRWITSLAKQQLDDAASGARSLAERRVHILPEGDVQTASTMRRDSLELARTAQRLTSATQLLTAASTGGQAVQLGSVGARLDSLVARMHDMSTAADLKGALSEARAIRGDLRPIVADLRHQASVMPDSAMVTANSMVWRTVGANSALTNLNVAVSNGRSLVRSASRASATPQSISELVSNLRGSLTASATHLRTAAMGVPLDYGTFLSGMVPTAFLRAGG
jgi:hypothetical protein